MQSAVRAKERVFPVTLNKPTQGFSYNQQQPLQISSTSAVEDNGHLMVHNISNVPGSTCKPFPFIKVRVEILERTDVTFSQRHNW